MPNRFYQIERPRKEKKLPKILSNDEVKKLINAATNIKHKCILALLYSAGLRRAELLMEIFNKCRCYNSCPRPTGTREATNE